MHLLSMLFIFLLTTVSGQGARGRKPLLSYEEITDLFQRHSAYFVQSKNRPIRSTDQIFSIMSQEIAYRMKPLALYSAFKRHRSKLLITDMEEGVFSNDEMNTTSCTYSDTDNSFNKELGSDYKQQPEFSFDLDTYDLKKIEPIYANKRRSGTCSYQKYITLPKFKWSSMIKEKIWTSTKLPCTWSLRKSNIREDSFNLIGKCSQCNAEIKIRSSKITDKFVKCTCIIHNFDKSFKHNPKIKSRLTTYKRQQLAKELRCKPAVVVHKELTSKFVSGDEKVSCPVVPSMSALRKIRHDDRMGQLRDTNPIISLLCMAKTPSKDNLKNMIREISVHPSFRLCYWSNQQIEYYNCYFQKFRKITITVDATGSLFKKITLPDGMLATKRLFLYQGLITANDKLKSVPTFQMITDAHDQQSISKCLKNWLSLILCPPHEIITDDSSAIILACVQAFTVYSSTKDYLKKMFSILVSPSSCKPGTFIRLDTSHFIKTLHNLTCFKKDIDSKIKYFYIRCIVLIKGMEDFEATKKLVLDIIEVSLGVTDDDNNDSEYIAAKRSIERLFKKLKDQYTPPEDEVQNDDCELDDFNDESTEDLEFIIWFDKAVENVKLKNQGQNIQTNRNLLYYPAFIPTLRRLLIKLPLWSNLLCPVYNSENKAPSSSGVESYFKTLKNHVFKSKVQRYRVDEFFKQHSEFLNGEIKSALNDLILNVKNKAKNKQAPKHTKKRKIICTQPRRKMEKKPKISLESSQVFSKDSIFADNPSYIENWRDQGKENSSKSFNKIKFIKNGSISQSVNVADKVISVINTCAFDSVMFLLCVGFTENENISSILLPDGLDDNLISKYIKCLTNIKDGDGDEDGLPYTLRAEISLQYADRLTEYENLLSYNFECNVTTIFEKIIFDYNIYSALYTKLCCNPLCQSGNITKKYTFLSINIDLINVFDISILEEAILIREEQKQCLLCDNQVTYNYQISNLISFDLNQTGRQMISDIPRTIKVKNAYYKIIGAIEFIPGATPHGLGHYRSHGFINDRVIMYDDLRLKFVETKPDEFIFIHSLSYGFIEI